MVRIPSFSRNQETAPTRAGSQVASNDRSTTDTSSTATVTSTDETRDSGRVAVADRPVRTTDTRATDTRSTDTRANDTRSTDTRTTTRPRPVDTDRRLETNRRSATDRTTDVPRKVDTDRVPQVDPSTERVVPAGPRPRASMLATLGLIVGVAAALFVLTGTLAGYGIGLGVLALLFSIGGVSATGRRHVAGKTDALIGLMLGLGAVLLGVLAVSGEFGWPTMDGDTVQRFREWLDSQFVNRF
ncbi:thrombospondin [Micromonospora sp. NPDC003197]